MIWSVAWLIAAGEIYGRRGAKLGIVEKMLSGEEVNLKCVLSSSALKYLKRTPAVALSMGREAHVSCNQQR